MFSSASLNLTANAVETTSRDHGTICAFLLPKSGNTQQSRRSGMRCEGGDTQVTIVGIVTPCEWDGEDRIRSFAVHSWDEQQVIIENRGRGRQLERMLRRKVRVTGRVTTSEEGRKTMVLDRFETLTDEDS
jgi:hypothetical protein